jgi:hypothetical protein
LFHVHRFRLGLPLASSPTTLGDEGALMDNVELVAGIYSPSPMLPRGLGGSKHISVGSRGW